MANVDRINDTMPYFNVPVKELFAYITVPWDPEDPMGDDVNVSQYVWLTKEDSRRLSEVVEDLHPLDVLNVQLNVCYQNGSRRIFSCLTGESRSINK